VPDAPQPAPVSDDPGAARAAARRKAAELSLVPPAGAVPRPDEPRREPRAPAKPEGSPGPEDDIHLSLREHLLELRQRLKWAVIWLGLGFCASYYWSTQIFHFLMVPVLASLPEGEKALHYSSGVEPFLIYLKVGMYAGLFVASPFIFWQVWMFVAPGLYRKERKAILPFVAAPRSSSSAARPSATW